jgi:hypothetical protein
MPNTEERTWETKELHTQIGTLLEFLHGLRHAVRQLAAHLAALVAAVEVEFQRRRDGLSEECRKRDFRREGLRKDVDDMRGSSGVLGRNRRVASA